MAYDERKERILKHLQLSSEIIKPKQSKIKRQTPVLPIVATPEPEANQEDTATAEIAETPTEGVIKTPKPPKSIPTRKASKEDKKGKIMAHLKSGGGLDPASTQSKDEQRKEQIQSHLRKSI